MTENQKKKKERNSKKHKVKGKKMKNEHMSKVFSATHIETLM